MKNSSYKSYDELPLFLNAETTAKLLGISISGMYELMHEKGFPVLKIGTRLVVPREKFREWVEQNVGKWGVGDELLPNRSHLPTAVAGVLLPSVP